MMNSKMKFELISKLLINHKYKPIKSIGAGSFGDVYLVEDSTGNKFAAKVISKVSLKKKPLLEKYISQ